MKSGQFVYAAATLSAVLSLALARPAPVPQHPGSLGEFLTFAGLTMAYTGAAAGMGALVHSGYTDRKVARAQAEKKAALGQLESAQQQVKRVREHRDGLKTDLRTSEGSLEEARKQAEAATFKVNELQAKVPTAKDNYAQLSRCWFAELQIAIQESRAATWPDSIGDDKWAKCVKFHHNPDVVSFRRPALDSKKAGAALQKKRGYFQDSAAAVSIIDRPMAFVHSPAVQRQMHNLHHNLQKINAAGMREVKSLEKFAAREEGALQNAAVGFRAAGLRAGEV
ncbi:MAG: hypothetical protein M1826_001519 [Phylliscum demangeonii]|nr:MAG: hypothetical protein M1826_001519 [Phylliscum demangeonii]